MSHPRKQKLRISWKQNTRWIRWRSSLVAPRRGIAIGAGSHHKQTAGIIPISTYYNHYIFLLYIYIYRIFMIYDLQVWMLPLWVINLCRCFLFLFILSHHYYWIFRVFNADVGWSFGSKVTWPSHMHGPALFGSNWIRVSRYFTGWCFGLFVNQCELATSMSIYDCSFQFCNM